MKNVVPYKLYFQSGGAFADFDRYQKIGKHLLYQKFLFTDEPYSKISQPNPQQWRKFSLLLDEINVWRWQSKYDNPGVDDGLQWEFEIVYKTKKLVCKGDNNYPQADGSPNNSFYMTESFGSLLDALEELRKKQKV